MFKYQVNNFVNIKSGKVLDVSGGRDAEGQNIIVWKRHNGLNQKWRIIYVDTTKEEKKEGIDLVWGFHYDRPFYLRSKMPGGRTVEVVGGRNLVIRRVVKDREE